MKKHVLASTMIALILALAMVAPLFSPAAYAAEIKFSDVKAGEYYETSVYWAVEKGITKGMTETTFGPSLACTRGQIATFLYRAAGSPEVTAKGNPFKDVKKGSYYYDAVLWAVENKITNGMSETTFEPESTCTRGQIVTFIYRSLESPKVKSSTTNPFKDITKKDYFYDAVLYAIEKEITKGISADKFGPASSCTRGQVVTFIYRADQAANAKVTLEEKMEEFLDKYQCSTHGKIDVIFNFGSSLTIENIEALIRQGAELDDTVTVEINEDDFNDMKERYSSNGDKSYTWPDSVGVTLTDTVTGEKVETDMAFSLQKLLATKYRYPNGAFGVCPEDCNGKYKIYQKALEDAAAKSEEEPVDLGENVTVQTVEEYFRKETGMTAESIKVYVDGLDDVDHDTYNTVSVTFVIDDSEYGKVECVAEQICIAVKAK